MVSKDVTTVERNFRFYWVRNLHEFKSGCLDDDDQTIVGLEVFRC